jgi:hypothetical protein
LAGVAALTRPLDPLNLLHDKEATLGERLLLLSVVPGGDTAMHRASACGRVECLGLMVEYAEAEAGSELRTGVVEVRGAWCVVRGAWCGS